MFRRITVCSTLSMKSWVLSMPPWVTWTTHTMRVDLLGRMVAMFMEASETVSLMGPYILAGMHL